MAASDSFKEMLAECLDGLGPFQFRRMFGGAGLFQDGLMFALIADDTLYFKADDTNRGMFEAEGCGPFTYQTKNGRNTLMSYWQAPERLFDEPEDMLTFARAAVAAARRSAKPKKPPRKKAK
jgi:DNA transformation protein